MNTEVTDWLNKHYDYKTWVVESLGGRYIIIKNLYENINADLFFHRNEVITIERVKERIGRALKEIIEQHRSHISNLATKINELKKLD